MSLDKAIKSGKEHRKPYRDARRFDRSCRNNKYKSYYSNNRQINKIRAKYIPYGDTIEYYYDWLLSY